MELEPNAANPGPSDGMDVDGVDANLESRGRVIGSEDAEDEGKLCPNSGICMSFTYVSGVCRAA